MADGVWADGDRWTVSELLAARLESDADGELFDVNGEQWTARTHVRRGQPLRERDARATGSAQGDRDRHPRGELVGGGDHAVRRRADRWGSVPINTAYKGEYLRHQLADSGARCS